MPASLAATPPSLLAPAPQSCPATEQPLAPGALGWPQTPTSAPCAFVQMPPQHSKSDAQTSPFCEQKETAPAQTPLRHTREQQSPFAPHSLPAVRHEPFSGTQTELPPSEALQVPPQHSADVEQGWLSEVQSLAPHVPLLHTNVQQSWGIAHALPAARHSVMALTQMPAVRSQLAVQQSALAAQVAPTRRQAVASPPIAAPLAPPEPDMAPPEPPIPVSALELPSGAASAPEFPPMSALPLVPQPMRYPAAQSAAEQAYTILSSFMASAGTASPRQP
jgi:hypothetical protein